MRWIAAIWAHALVEAAVAEGVGRRELEDAIGEALPAADPARLSWSARLPESAHLATWKAVMQLRRDPGFPIRFGMRLSPDAYDVLGLACKTAESVDEALERLARYLHLWTNTVRCTIDRHAAGARVSLHRPGRRDLALRCANESAVAEMLHALRAIAVGELTPRAAHFMHAPPDDLGPDDLKEHRRFFGCPLTFSSDFDGLVLDSEALATPLELADPGLSRYLLARLDEEDARRSDAPPLMVTLRATIGDLLPEGRPTMARVARHLGMSTRTLRRRLEAEGLGFADVVADVRRVIADELLAAGRPVAEVTYLVGYSEPSAFHRAYKAWTGRTPRG